jgi:hypothetical protein
MKKVLILVAMALLVTSCASTSQRIGVHRDPGIPQRNDNTGGSSSMGSGSMDTGSM